MSTKTTKSKSAKSAAKTPAKGAASKTSTTSPKRASAQPRKADAKPQRDTFRTAQNRLDYGSLTKAQQRRYDEAVASGASHRVAMHTAKPGSVEPPKVLKTYRVESELYDETMRLAREHGDELSEILRKAMRSYVKRKGGKLPA